MEGIENPEPGAADLLSGALTGLMGSLGLVLLMLGIDNLDMRDPLINWNPKLFRLLTFENSIGFGSLVWVTVGVGLGTIGASVHQVSSQIRKMMAYATFGLFSFAVLEAVIAPNISADLIEVIESEHKTSGFVSKNNPSFNQTQTQNGITEKTSSLINTKVILISIILLIIVGGVYYFGFKPFANETKKEPTKVVVLKEEYIKLTFENYIDSMNINGFHEDFMKKVQESPKLKEPSFEGSFQIFFFSKEDRLMPIIDYREYFGRSSNWNKNKDKRSKDDYLKILVKDSILVDHTIPPKDVEQTLENNDQDIIFSEKQQKELDEIARQKAEEKKRKEEKLKAFEEEKNDSISKVEKENKKKIKKKEKPEKNKEPSKNENSESENEEKDKKESKKKIDK